MTKCHEDNPHKYVIDPNNSKIFINEIIEFITFEVKKKIDKYFIEKFLSIELMIKEKIIMEECVSDVYINGDKK
jgi:hypothetical protein